VTTPAVYDAAYFDRMRGAADLAGLYDDFMDLLAGLDLPSMAVLDAGCGRGELLARLCRAGARSVTGVDFSPEAVTRATRAAGPAARVVEGSLTDASLLPAASFDLVTMTDVVEHLPPAELAACLSNVRRWLRPGGRLLVHTFPTLWLHRAYNASLRLAGRGRVADENDRIHCNVQTQRRLSRVMTDAGLTCERMWLRNDLLKTSSVYQSMRPGWPKRMARWLGQDLPSSTIVRGLFAAAGLAELVSPSIYAWGRVNASRSRSTS